MYTRDERGTLTVYAGPMFSGKSTKLIETLQTYDSHAAVKPATDTRYAEDDIVTHDGKAVDASAIPQDTQDFSELFEYVEQREADAVGIDEAQFFGDELVDAVYELREHGYDVVVAGLDKDFRKEDFGPVPEIIADAQEDGYEPLTADCDSCGEDAAYTQRLIDGEPAPYDSPQVLVGGKESYEPRCEDHHLLPETSETSVQSR